MQSLWLTLFIFVFMVLGQRPASGQTDPVSALSHDPVWLKLGHYQKRVFGGYKSDIDDLDFFLDPEGRSDPEKELRATLRELTQESTLRVGRLKQIPICAFPARYAWLKKKLLIKPSINPLESVCTEQTEWKKGLGAKSATVIFSSAYPNNPASMFGHTLLRLNQENGEAILNYGVNFEARVDGNDSALLYAFKGLFGLYRGEFSLAPYYMKVNEYNFSESRDLWEYELSLSPDELNFLVDHLWELYSTGSFSYLFLTENCSYQLLALLEVSKPEWNLTDGFSIYTLPVDTVKKLNSHPGIILSEKKRSSLYSQMITKINRLTPEQKRMRQDVLQGVLDIGEVTDIDVLDSVVTTLDYERRKSAGDLPKAKDMIFRAVLLRRAALGNRTVMQSLSENSSVDSPLATHHSKMLTVGAIVREGQLLGTLGGRFLLHDLMDPNHGYPPGLQVVVGEVQMSATSTNGQTNVRLEKLNLLDILSLYPANSGEMQFSWALRAGSETPLDFERTDVLATGFEAGPGIAASLGNKSGWIYALALANGQFIPAAPKSGRYGPGSELGLVWHVTESFSVMGKLRTMLELNHPWDRLGYIESEGTAAWTFNRDLQFRMHGRTGGTQLIGTSTLNEVASEIRWYF